jgi:plastocyanin
MKRLILLGLMLALLSVAAAPVPQTVAGQTAVSQTYSVNVGYENVAKGALIEAFFPDTVTIHVGDTVHFVQKTHEIHTVTFATGSNVPADLGLIDPPTGGAITPVFNPAAVFPTVPANNLFDGSSFANSGLMSLDPGNPTSFDLTFTKAGVYNYYCIVHGQAMSGKVVVLSASKKVPSPAQTSWLGNKQLAEKVSEIGDVVEAAYKSVPKPVRNSDGTTTYHILIGYDKGQVDLVRFFPSKLNVRPGDTVIWDLPVPMSGMDMPPHTVTFLNGTPDPDLVVPLPQQNGPPVLELNPQLVIPAGGPVLTRSGYFNSGLLASSPPGGPTSYTLKIGAISGVIDYMCLLHDGSGMVATLNVVKK